MAEAPPQRQATIEDMLRPQAKAAADKAVARFVIACGAWHVKDME